ncbi:metallophosphoesterase family protein [Cytobacillus gottheilii]|uniref:Metallophosphoesterase family protein n=1 Tax=Cytobacillus gottheilii TaxID=859144 RepID=A0ABX8FCF9_9BACI|nr:metallophosphoesterase [Cytobacillus gottheilii]QVY62060.1 metallophosphoesterase family protein [Cytobacillus gottheilii]
MDKIAVISDIHGNLTALEAVLDDIEIRDIHTILCLGDLIGKGPNSKKVLELIREKCEVVVLGNWDDFIRKPIDSSEIVWQQNQLDEGDMAYLGSLPYHYDFYMSGKYVRLFHASAKSVYHRVFPMGASIEELQDMFANTEWIVPLEDGAAPDVVGYGDIHAALIQPIYPQRMLFNAGSVGNSLDMRGATYCILHGVYQSKEAAPFSIELVRLPYDIEKELLIAKEMGLPGLEAYELELRECRYRGRPKSE